MQKVGQQIVEGGHREAARRAGVLDSQGGDHHQGECIQIVIIVNTLIFHHPIAIPCPLLYYPLR